MSDILQLAAPFFGLIILGFLSGRLYRLPEKELGWLKDAKMPRLVSCQAEGCAPIVRAFDQGERFAELVAF